MQFIEDIAYDFVTMSDAGRWAISYGLFLFGAIVAAFVRHRLRVMRRGPYFGYTALLIFAVAASQAIWIFVLEARSGGYLWVLVAANAGWMILIGWSCYRIAKARSLDCVADEAYAALAVLPILNLVLFFKPSTNSISSGHSNTPLPQMGGPGIATGCAVLIAAAVLSVFVSDRLDEQPILLPSDDPAAVVAELESLLRTNSLSRVLRIIARQAPQPVYVDEETTLLHMQASGNLLTRTYVIDSAAYGADLEELIQDVLFQTLVEVYVCSYPPAVLLLNEGATIREVFLDVDRNRVAEHVITQESCGS